MKLKYQVKCVMDWLRFPILFVVLCCLDTCVQWDLAKCTLGGWYFLIKGGCVWGMTLGALCWLLGRWSKWPYFMIYVWMAFVLLVEWFVRLHFNMAVIGDWMMLVAGSSKDESASFVGEYVLSWKTLVLIVAFCFVLLLGVATILKSRYVRPTWYSVLGALMVWGFVPSVMGFKMGSFSGWKAFSNRLISKYIVSDSIRRHTEYKELIAVIQQPQLPQLKTSFSPGDEPVGVFVIGESATRNNMQLYGYTRSTTPFLDSKRDELCVFSDVIAGARMTQFAIRYLLTDAEHGQETIHYTFPQALKECGYDLALLSTQGKWGVGSGESLVSTILSTLDRRVYLDDVTNEARRYDGMLLPYLHNELVQVANKPRIVLFHTNGSHFNFKDRYEPSRALFADDLKDGLTKNMSTDMRVRYNRYDNTILYTDYILSQVVAELEKVNRPAFMIYISDHGETPRSRTLRSELDPDKWEIPFVVWFSDEYKRLFPNVVRRVAKAEGKKLQSDQLLEGFLEIAGVKVGDGVGNFLDEDWCGRDVRSAEGMSYENDIAPRK